MSPRVSGLDLLLPDLALFLSRLKSEDRLLKRLQQQRFLRLKFPGSRSCVDQLHQLVAERLLRVLCVLKVFLELV